MRDPLCLLARWLRNLAGVFWPAATRRVVGDGANRLWLLFPPQLPFRLEPKLKIFAEWATALLPELQSPGSHLIFCDLVAHDPLLWFECSADVYAPSLAR